MSGGRSPLGRARGLGPARGGTAHWWAQRLTAIALVPLALWFIVSMASLAGAGHAAAAAWMASPLSAGLLILFAAVGLHHTQLGLQVVIEDYVHGEAAKLALVILVRFAAVVLGLAAVLAVLKVALGS